MKKNLTELVFILDRSGSMAGLEKDTIGGFNAYDEVYCDMIPSGIVDPTKVTRSALQNAASVAAILLTTESLVADKKEPVAPAAPAGDMGGMY